MFKIIDEKSKEIKKLTSKQKLEIGNYGEKRTNEKIVDIILFFTSFYYPRRWYIEKGMYQKMTPFERYKKYQTDGIDGLIHYNSILVQIKTRQLGYFLEDDIYLELGRKINGKDHYTGWFGKDIDLLLYYFYDLSKKKLIYGYAILLDEFKKIYNTIDKIKKKFKIQYDSYNFDPPKIYFCPKFTDFKELPDTLIYDITPIIKDLI